MHMNSLGCMLLANFENAFCTCFIGNFGVVYKGDYTRENETVEVAIKTVKGRLVITNWLTINNIATYVYSISDQQH